MNDFRNRINFTIMMDNKTIIFSKKKKLNALMAGINCQQEANN